jgi:NTP pyrophosphatase (non-canonical NTP hydrolase)
MVETMNISDLIQESYGTACDKGWHDRFRSFGEAIALCHSELSEALEEARNGHTVGAIRFVDGKPEGIPIELADVLIRIFDYCGECGIPLEIALRTKLDYNKSRPHRHGGKML